MAGKERHGTLLAPDLLCPPRPLTLPSSWGILVESKVWAISFRYNDLPSCSPFPSVVGNSGPVLTTVSTLGDFTFYTATCLTAWLCSLAASVPVVFTHTLYFRILITTHTCPVGIPISNILLLGRSASPPRFLIPSLPHTCSFISAAAAAKSLQSCPALCDPIDSSPPVSSVPGILQARVLEWGAIAFSALSSLDPVFSFPFISLSSRSLISFLIQSKPGWLFSCSTAWTFNSPCSPPFPSGAMTRKRKCRGGTVHLGHEPWRLSQPPLSLLEAGNRYAHSSCFSMEEEHSWPLTLPPLGWFGRRNGRACLVQLAWDFLSVADGLSIGHICPVCLCCVGRGLSLRGEACGCPAVLGMGE